MRIHDFKPRRSDSGGDLGQSELAAPPSVFVRDALAEGGEDARGTAKEVPAGHPREF